MDTLKQRIFDYVKAHHPVRRVDLCKSIGIPGKALDREISALKSTGLIHSAAGFGYFPGIAAYEAWKKGEGAVKLQIRGMKGGLSSAESRRESLSTYPSRIVDLLSDGDELSAKEISEALGVEYRKISSAMSMLTGTGEIRFSGSKGNRLYRIGKRNPKGISRTESVNVICQECRQSEAMKRVLSVYGVRA